VSLTELEPVAPKRPRVGSLLLLYLLRLRRRWPAEVMAVLGIAAGVALLYAASVASESLSAPVRSLNQGIVGNSQLELLSRGAVGMPEATYDQVVAIDGVRRAAPVLEVPGNVVGPKGERAVTFFGSDPRIVRLRGNLLDGLSSSDAAQQDATVITTPIAEHTGVKFGDDIRVEMAGRRHTVPAILAGKDQIGPLTETSIALLPLRYLQRLIDGGPTVTRILVEAEPGKVDAVRRHLGTLAAGLHVDVRPSDFDSRAFANAAKPTDQATLAFSVLSALVGFLFAACALLVTTADRRKSIVQQRELGVRPRARLYTMLVDAAIVGALGVVVGLTAGEALSRAGFSSDVSFLSGAFPVGEQRIVTWQSVAIAAAGGMIAAVVGVLAPLHDVVVPTLPRRMRRDGRLRRLGAGGGRFLTTGIVCLASAIAIAVLAPAAVMVGLALLGIALVLCLPAMLAGAIATLESWNRRGPWSWNTTELALQQLKTRSWRPRALAIAMTGAVAVFGATALQGARVNLQAGLDDLTTGLTETTDVWAAPRGAGSSIGTAGFAATATRALAAQPAVARVDLYRAGLLDLAEQRTWVIGQPVAVAHPIPPHQVLDGDERRATAELRSGSGWATVSRALADALNLHVGQTFDLPSPRPIPLRVAAITTNLGWSAGALVLNANDFEGAWGTDAVAAYQIRLRPGTPPSVGRQQVAAALGGDTSALRVETGRERGDRQRAITRAGLARLRQITTVTLIAAVLAMAAAMVGLLWQHRPMISHMKAHGVRSTMMWRMLLIETGVLFGTGAIAGGVFGLLGQVLGTDGVQAVTGFPADDGLRLGVAVTTVGIVVAASLLVVAVPGWLIARVRPSWRS
jgi:putative ABC transport system permease protein